MKLRGLFKTAIAAVVFAALCAATALGQGAWPASEQGTASGQVEQDPPGRVARLQYINGQVSVQPGGLNDWIAGTLNRPLTTADRVWTDKGSRTELSLGTSVIRMNSETSLTLTNVDTNSLQLELDEGTLSLTVFRLFDGEIIEVDTPNTAFTIMKAGEYRFDVLPDADQTWVTVRSGSGEATGQGRAVRIDSDEQARFTGGTSMVHTAQSAPPRDGFEDWVKVRNQREENSVSAKYVAPGVIGYQDLDSYGYWRTAPGYGAVWCPTVAAGWAPYRYGHWAWIDPWGWTWVDDAPWGFAPFHYGRWVSWGGGWAWAPGPVVGYGRPIWAPALVGFIGGPQFGVGLAFGVGGGVGWFPLGFGEPFVPWYHTGFGYFQSVNVSNTRITNVTVITNIYNHPAQVSNFRFANQNVAGAVTAVPKSSFIAGRQVGAAGVVVPRSALQQATVVRTAGVAPVRESVLGGHTPLSNGVPPARAFSRPVVTHQAPPPRPVSFAAKQPLLANNNGMPLDHATVNNLRTQGASSHASPAVTQPGNIRTGGNTPNSPGQPALSPRPGTPSAGPAANVNGNANRVAPPPNTNTGGNTPANGHYVPRPPERTNGNTDNRVGPNADAGANTNHVGPTPNANTGGSGPGNSPNVVRPPQNGSTNPAGNSTGVTPRTNTQGQVNRNSVPNPPHTNDGSSKYPSGPASPKTVNPPANSKPQANPSYRGTPESHGEGKAGEGVSK